MEYILAAKMRCKKLFIGLTNPDSLHTRDSVNDENMSLIHILSESTGGVGCTLCEGEPADLKMELTCVIRESYSMRRQ